jgi:hypothetical protein
MDSQSSQKTSDELFHWVNEITPAQACIFSCHTCPDSENLLCEKGTRTQMHREIIYSLANTGDALFFLRI